MLNRKHLLISCCALLFASLQCGQAADGFNAGPLFDDFPLTLSPGHRSEALGPLFYHEAKESQQTWAVPPLFSRVHDTATDSTEFDLVYPVFTYDRFGSEFRWHIFQVISYSGGQNQQAQNARRFTLFPIYFQQRSAESNQNYTAVFPLYGHLLNRFFRDELFFVLFPIYGQTRKKDVVTDNYLYPFFHLRHGDSLRGWQFWPIIGSEHKEITSRTNGFGDVERIAGHHGGFLLWPIFLSQVDGLGTENPQRQRAIFPLYSEMRSAQRDLTTVLWPLFTHITDREKKYKEWQILFILNIFAHGEGKTATRIWPFYSHAESPTLVSDFILWPVYKFNRMHTETFDRSRSRILFFLYSDVVEKNLSTGGDYRRIDFFPLDTYRRDYNGNTRFQILSILEPFLPASKSIERNYSPVWALWRSEKNPKTGASSQSLLWNLYRRDATPETKKCSLLFGLFQYQSGSEGKRLRLFYVPVVRTRPATTAGAK